MKIGWDIEVLQSAFLCSHSQMKAGNKSCYHKSPSTNDSLTQSFLLLSRLFFFWHSVRLVMLTQLKRRQSISISYFHATFLSACLFPQNLSACVCARRRRQLKESVYGDKLQQYNTGGGASIAETLNKLCLHTCLHTPNFPSSVYICTF